MIFSNPNFKEKSKSCDWDDQHKMHWKFGIFFFFFFFMEKFGSFKLSHQ